MNDLDLIKKDKYLNEFIKKNNLDDSFVSDHINAFKMCLDSRNKCVNCKGLHMCNQSTKGQRIDLSYLGALISEIEYCDYLKAKNEEDKVINSYVYSNIPETFKNVDINTIELLDDNQKLLCAKLMAILTNKINRGLYIYGDLGVGKTYECIALANALVKKGKKVSFIKSASFINEMRQTVTIDSSLFNEKMNKIKKCEYLFVDDIGTESVSSFSRDDVLFDILDYRMENKLCTIFTSNLDKESLKKHYTYDKKDNSNLTRAKRLVERIDILGEDFALVGENKRR